MYGEGHSQSSLSQWFDPLQFVCKRSGGTQGETLALMNTVTNHLQQSKSCAKFLFMHFSSALNCSQKLTLIKKAL